MKVTNPLPTIRIFLFMIFTILTSCKLSPLSKMERAFSAVFHPNDLNTSIKLEIGQKEADFENKLSMAVILINQSDYYIVFPSNYGVKIFRYLEDDEQWVEVINAIRSTTEHKRILGPYGGNEAYHVPVSFKPDIVVIDSPIVLRVTVSGNVVLEDGDIGEQVGAFVDITLIP